MIWYPVTFTNRVDSIGTVHQYVGNPDRSMVTRCGIRLADDHGVVDTFTTKPWCSICDSTVI